MNCLFKNYEQQPPELVKIVNKYSLIQENKGLSFNDCKEFLKKVEKIGYTFNYGLDSVPYNLRKSLKTRIKLSEELVKGLEKRNIKTVDIILFLISEGFETEKEPFLTSLGELKYNGKQVVKVATDQLKNELIITFKA